MKVDIFVIVFFQYVKKTFTWHRILVQLHAPHHARSTLNGDCVRTLQFYLQKWDFVRLYVKCFVLILPRKVDNIYARNFLLLRQVFVHTG